MDENDESEKYELVPPDGGWGWLVLFGCTLINLLIPGTIKSFGVLFVEFLEIFEFSEIAASWIPALCYFLYCSLGPLTSYLTHKFSYRTITLVGGTIASIGMITSYFATSVLHLCITGAVLIMGAISMNVWVGALFYHPVSWHMKKVPLSCDVIVFNEKTELPQMVVSDTDLAEKKHYIRVTKTDDKNETINLVSTASEKNITTNSNFLFNSKKTHLNQPFRGSQNSLRRNSSYLSISSVKFAGSSEGTLGRLPESVSQLTLKSLESFEKPAAISKNVTKLEKETHFVDLLRNPVFVIIMISNATTAIGYTNFTIFLPYYAISLNYDKTISSCLLSIVAFFDLIGRIGGSTISDILPLHKKYYFILGLMISGISLVVLPLVNTYTTLCIACAIFGLSSGTYTGITVVTMVEMLGEEKLATSYTLSLFVNGVLQLVGPPICGAIHTNLNSFGAIISGLGITITIGAGVWIVLPFVTPKDK
ncbi:monocarboxylate transporter 13 isoform X2 [Planococcus citri]|uniref:monocarboxylate transporter 13 isoform X2 n=1 Tax=Planococcus citri TaxID=170843 RepID=UPI0031F76B4C